MRKTAMIAMAAMFALASIQAWADDQSPQGQTISIDAMKQKIDDLGYEVRRLKIDDGTFKALIVERESGGAVKATFSAQNGELIKARLAD
jgi:hypothetical protein